MKCFFCLARVVYNEWKSFFSVFFCPEKNNKARWVEDMGYLWSRPLLASMEWFYWLRFTLVKRVPQFDWISFHYVFVVVHVESFSDLGGMKWSYNWTSFRLFVIIFAVVFPFSIVLASVKSTNAFFPLISHKPSFLSKNKTPTRYMHILGRNIKLVDIK